MWADGKSPYRIVTLTPEQEELAERIRTVIDPRGGARRRAPGTEKRVESVENKSDRRLK